MRNELEMEEKVVQWLRGPKVETAQQVPVGNVKLDVVAYDKRSGVFKVIECKLTHSRVEMNKTFAQALAYKNQIAHHTDEFIDAVSRDGKIQMRFGRWMEATNCARKIRVEFYVALTDEACGDISGIRELKRDYRQFGIIRCKENGDCRKYLKENGAHIPELAQAETQEFLLQNRWSSPVVPTEIR